MRPMAPFGALWSLLLAILLVGCSSPAPEFAPLPRGSAVLALGDSVTVGVGAGSGEDYPTRLAEISGWVIHNHGVSGDTSSGARARLEEALAEAQPKLVIVEIGGNDFLRRQPTNSVKENIRAILRRVKTAGIPVVLVAVPAFSPLGAAVGRLSDAELYAELADEEKVPLVPAVFARVLSDPKLKADTIHPNAAGYRQLAEGIATELIKTGLLAKP
jgi:acyl-CoA thioesterase-1